MINWIETIDFAILNRIQEFLRNDFLDLFFPFITALGNGGIFWIILGIGMLFFSKSRRYGIVLLAVLAVGALLGEGFLKPLIGRVRPCNVNQEISMLIARPHSFSFPSGHSWASFASAVVLWKADRRVGIAAFILAVLIAFSRMYLYVHFPTDVLVGSLCGAATGWLGIQVMNMWMKRRKDIPAQKKNKGAP